MDNFAYLNQISASSRPHPRQTSAKKLSIIKILIGGLVLFVLLMAFGAMLGSLKGKTTALTKQLYLRSTNLETTVTANATYLKSSKLRAISASLSTVLNNTTHQLSSFLTKDADSKKTEELLTPKASVVESETSLIAELNQSLTNARLNGLLDRVYDNQIGLQVSLLLSMTSNLIARTKDPELTSILTTFYSSLSTIHQSLEAYSNPGN